jgi:putative DNA primase/helicase
LTGSIQNFAIRRVANRFALVQVALGLAHSYGLLPFPVEDIDWAVSTLFQDWLTARGSHGPIEVKNACDAIGYLLTTQENGERFFTFPENDGLKPRNQLGYRRREVISADSDGTTYGATEELWIFPEVFREELCEGINPTEVAKELINRGWLTTGQSGNVTQTQKIKGKVQRFYCFRKWVSSSVTGVTTVTPDPEQASAVTPEEDPSVTGVTLPSLVTPVTPEQEASVTAESLAHQQVTPVTAVTPKKLSNPKLGANPQIRDVEDI